MEPSRGQMTTLQVGGWLDAIGARASRFSRPARDALVVVGILRALYFFFVQDIRPWEFAGVDARAYWQVDLAHPYAAAGLGDVSSYLYSPAFAQALAPFGAMPFSVFFALWTAVSVAILLWLVRPWPWAVPILSLPIIYELCVGNIHFLLAAVAVVGFRRPGLWALPVFTKITPGVGIGWFAFRREWRDLAVAIGITSAIVAVSFVLSPSAWFEWVAYLSPSSGRSEALIIRVAVALLLLGFGAWTGRRWLVPVAMWLALPVIYVNSWVILLAIIRLREDVAPVGRRPVA